MTSVGGDRVTKYARTVDGLSIAYQVVGDGPIDVVVIPGMAGHVELNWEVPAWQHIMERFSSIARILIFDKRGTGLSDHAAGAATLEERVDDITAVMDAAGMSRAAVFGQSEGGAMAIMFTATHPDRVSHLMVHGGLAVGTLSNERIPPDVREKTAEAVLTELAETWGTGRTMFDRRTGPTDTALSALRARMERSAAPPGTIVELMRMNMTADVRPVLPAISAPTLVTHCTGDPVVPFWQGRYLAEHITGAELVPIDAEWHTSTDPADMDVILDAVEEFITGTVARSEVADRVLATVLFTDIVESTSTAAAVGDAKWTRQLEAHDAVVRRQVERFRGEVVKQTGDGVLATFDGPGRAIECARAIRDELARSEVVVRAGLHTGEVTRRDDDIAGIAVHIAARVQQAAPPGEIWVSPTIPGLVAGGGFDFDERGEFELKGVPGTWKLAAVV